MNKIIIVDETTDIDQALRDAKLMQAIGVIVTEPKHLNTAQRFDVDIVAIFGNSEQAIKKAQEIAEQSDSAIVVITGEN